MAEMHDEALRRSASGGARLSGAEKDGQEGDRILPGVCRRHGIGLGYQQIPGLGQGSEEALTPTIPTLPRCRHRYAFLR